MALSIRQLGLAITLCVICAPLVFANPDPVPGDRAPDSAAIDLVGKELRSDAGVLKIIAYQPDGSYVVERHLTIDGETVVESGRAFADANNQLRFDFSKAQDGGDDASSATSAVASIFEGPQKSDISRSGFVVERSRFFNKTGTPELLPPPELDGNHDVGAESAPVDTDSTNTTSSEIETEATPNTATSDANLKSADEPLDQQTYFPIALAVAASAAGAASVLAGGRQSSEVSVGTDLDATQALDLQQIARLEAELNSINVDLPPKLTEADLRKVGNIGDRHLNELEQLVLAYTNQQILSGEGDSDLAKNLAEARNAVSSQFTAAEAAVLDGTGSKQLSPIEVQALEITNTAIITGQPNTDLRQNYRQLLINYQKHQAVSEAEELFKAFKGVGVDEEAVFAIIHGKSAHQLNILNQAFERVAAANGWDTSERTDWGTRYNSYLEYTIADQVSGGWEDKIFDAYNGKSIGEDRNYFWLSAAAHHWNNGLKAYNEFNDAIIANESIPGFLKLQAYQTKGLFEAAGAVNSAVKDAQEFYLYNMQNTDSRALKILNGAGYVFATLGGSFGTKALDPTLTSAETEEGLIDLALLVGTFGAGKLVQAGAKTTQGAAVLARISGQLQKLSRLSYTLRHAAGLVGRQSKLSALASRYRAIAKTSTNPIRAQRAAEAAARYEQAAASATRAEQAIANANRLKAAADAAVRNGDDVNAAARAVDDAVAAAATAKRELEALRLAEVTARQAGSNARMLTSALVTEPYQRLASSLRGSKGANRAFITDTRLEAEALMAQGLSRRDAFQAIRAFNEGATSIKVAGANGQEMRVVFHFTNPKAGHAIVRESGALWGSKNGVAGPGLYTSTIPNPNLVQKYVPFVGFGVNPGTTTRIPIIMRPDLEDMVRVVKIPPKTNIIGTRGTVIELKPVTAAQ